LKAAQNDNSAGIYATRTSIYFGTELAQLNVIPHSLKGLPTKENFVIIHVHQTNIWHGMALALTLVLILSALEWKVLPLSKISAIILVILRNIFIGMDLV